MNAFVVQLLSCVWLFVTPWTAARQACLSFTISWSLLKLMSIKSMMSSNHLILCHPLLLLPSIFPSIGVFFYESALRIRWPKYWSFSFSISPSNEYSGLISFRMTGLISLLPKELSRVFSSTIQKHQFFRLRFLNGWTLTSVHDYWKNHIFDYMDLCRQSDSSGFCFFFLLYFTLQYCVGFAIHWHESTTGVHAIPHMNPPLLYPNQEAL